MRLTRSVLIITIFALAITAYLSRAQIPDSSVVTETMTEALLEPGPSVDAYIRLPMVQVFTRAELTALMSDCWDDALKAVTDAILKDSPKRDSSQPYEHREPSPEFTDNGSQAILAAAIFAVRVENLQSGKEVYMREWKVGSKPTEQEQEQPAENQDARGNP